jgi:hypothetical protein
MTSSFSGEDSIAAFDRLNRPIVLGLKVVVSPLDHAIETIKKGRRQESGLGSEISEARLSTGAHGVSTPAEPLHVAIGIPRGSELRSLANHIHASGGEDTPSPCIN